MKNTLCFRLAFVFIFFFLLNSASKGQPTTWAQPGAHWIYNLGDGSSFGSTGVAEVIRIGDTISNGISCDILDIHYMYMENWPTGQWRDYHDINRYTYESNDTVYMSYGNSFEVLFVENAQAGTFWISGPDVTSNCGGDTIFIDSVEVVNINGIFLNKLYPETFIWNDPNMPTVFFHYPIFERFGSLLYFTPLPTCIICPSWGPLICYTDSSGFYFSPNPAISCPVGILEISDSEMSAFTITPNPAKDEITITADISVIGPNEIGEIYNVLGNKSGSFMMNKKVQQLTISNLSPGSYFIKIKNRPQMKPVSFIKL